MRQFLTEAILLALVGGIFGVLAAVAGVDGLVALAPENLPRLENVSISVPVLLFAFLLSTLVRCGHCGRVMVGRTHRTRFGRHPDVGRVM